MEIYSKDDYAYLVRNGCYPDGYVEGVGIVSSQSIPIMSTAPSYPNERALGIDRRTQFMSSMQVPIVKPLIHTEAKRVTHEVLDELIKEMKENILMPAFTPNLKAMVLKLKEEIERKRNKNLKTIIDVEIILNIDSNNLDEKAKKKLEKEKQKAEKKKRKAEAENALLKEVEREIRIMATSNQKYDMITNYSFKSTSDDVVYHGGFDYNPTTRNAELRFNVKKPSLGAFAHELKHAYQFETGRISGPNRKSALFLYDKEDEREAFERGRLFGSSNTFESNASIYEQIPDSRNFNETTRSSCSAVEYKWEKWSTNVISLEVLHGIEEILKNPHSSPNKKANAENKLKNISLDFPGSAFRVNGNTYYRGRIITKNR